MNEYAIKLVPVCGACGKMIPDLAIQPRTTILLPDSNIKYLTSSPGECPDCGAVFDRIEIPEAVWSYLHNRV